MVISRRSLLQFISLSLFGVKSAVCADKHPKRTLPPKSQWTKQQVEGREEAEKKFRRRFIPRKHRDTLFEGLVYAVSTGERNPDRISAIAGDYLTTNYPEVPDWLKWLKIILPIIVNILWILIIFI